jgi:hypothetical protein
LFLGSALPLYTTTKIVRDCIQVRLASGGEYIQLRLLTLSGQSPFCALSFSVRLSSI